MRRGRPRRTGVIVVSAECSLRSFLCSWDVIVGFLQRVYISYREREHCFTENVLLCD